jgi:hypothetical protein
MKTSPSYKYEMSLFTAAAEALAIARGLGAAATGLDALLATDYMRGHGLHRLRAEELAKEDLEYYRWLGGYVELAVELNEGVDQQG